MSSSVPTLTELRARLAIAEKELADLQLGVYRVGIGIAGYGAMTPEAEAWFEDMRALMAKQESSIAQLKADIARQSS